MCPRMPWRWSGRSKWRCRGGRRNSVGIIRNEDLMPELKVFTGNSNPALAQEICDVLKVPLGKAEVGRFSDGEIQLKILENVRGADTYIVQPTSTPVNDSVME